MKPFCLMQFIMPSEMADCLHHNLLVDRQHFISLHREHQFLFASNVRQLCHFNRSGLEHKVHIDEAQIFSPSAIVP